MFRRTNSGESNRHLFFGVHYTVYVEGKPDDDENEETHDVAFWSNVLDRKKGYSFHIQSRGSKTGLMEIARSIASGEISNVIVCMDRDYGNFQGNTVMHKHVLYTFGYSWESDVCMMASLEHCSMLFAPNNINVNGVSADIDLFMRANRHALYSIFVADYQAVRQGKKAFCRDKPTQYLDLSGDSLALSLPRISDEIDRINADCCNSCGSTDIRNELAVRLVYGKLLSTVFYHWLVLWSKKRVARQKLSHAVFLSCAISHLWSSTSRLCSEIVRQYHEHQIQAI